jgi:hypothetical protein
MEILQEEVVEILFLTSKNSKTLFFDIFDKKLFGDVFVILNSTQNKMFVSSFVELNALYLKMCRLSFEDIGLRSCGWSKYVIYANVFQM